MSAWRNCKASIRLATEINGRWPNRDRLSDGTIGDAAHAARNSDHNPWIKDPDGTGVVRARDIDEDLDGNPANGVGDANVIAEHLRALGKAGDVRLANWGYVIYEGRIAGGNPTRGPGRWEWRPYTGTNAHRHHVHVSFSRDPEGYDSTAPWGLWPTTTEPTTPTTPEPEDIDMATAAELQSQIDGLKAMDKLVWAAAKRHAEDRDALIIAWAKGRLDATDDDVADLERQLAALATPDGLA